MLQENTFQIHTLPEKSCFLLFRSQCIQKNTRPLHYSPTTTITTPKTHTHTHHHHTTINQPTTTPNMHTVLRALLCFVVIKYWSMLLISFKIKITSRALGTYNYVNPVCCVATVCHQVRCMYWGHLGYFHRAISQLKWYKIVCMRYLACTFSQMKSINMFSMFLQSGVPRHFLWRFIAVWT